MEFNTILVLFATVLASAYCGKIPSYIHVCKRTDPEVAKCIRESIEVIRPRLRAGIPELDVPGLEPLHIPDIVLPGGEDATHYRAALKNIDVYGASDFQLSKLKIDVNNLVIRVGVSLPLLRLIGVYDVNARLLLVPIQGEGKFSANATNCVANAVLRGELKDGADGKYIHFTKLDLKLKIGDYNIHLDDLFNGDHVLSQATNDILNQNKQEFIDIATPFIQERVSKIILEVANKIVTNFNYDEVFPEK